MVLCASLALLGVGTNEDLVRIPGTDIKRPPTDQRCDTAFDNGDWAKAERLCRMAEIGYKRITSQAHLEKLRSVEEALIYDRAFTDFQIAMSLWEQGHKAQGHGYAETTQALFHQVHDGYWRKINVVLGREPDDRSPIDPTKYSAQLQQAVESALTDDQARLAEDFVSLALRVHAVYPDLFVKEAEIQAEDSDE